jgi:hypothetical protein
MGYIREMPILELKREFNLTASIETGTQWGEGTFFLHHHFPEMVYTIEIDPLRWNRVYDATFNVQNVRCILGSSPESLNTLLPSLVDDNILFWLDAHFPSDNYDEQTFRDINTFPLQRELEAILRHRSGLWRKGRKDVIIIDDARIYQNGEFELGNLEYCFNDNYFLEAFAETHDLMVDYRQTGYYILTPKK